MLLLHWNKVLTKHTYTYVPENRKYPVGMNFIIHSNVKVNWNSFTIFRDEICSGRRENTFIFSQCIIYNLHIVTLKKSPLQWNIHQCKLRLTTSSSYTVFQARCRTLCLFHIYTPNITCNCSDALTAHIPPTLISFYFNGRKFYTDTKYSLFSNS